MTPIYNIIPVLQALNKFSSIKLNKWAVENQHQQPRRIALHQLSVKLQVHLLYQMYLRLKSVVHIEPLVFLWEAHPSSSKISSMFRFI